MFLVKFLSQVVIYIVFTLCLACNHLSLTRMDGQQESNKERNRLQGHLGHRFPLKGTQRLLSPFSQNDKRSKQTARITRQQSPMMAQHLDGPQQNQQIQPIQPFEQVQETLTFCSPQQGQASNSKGVLEYGMQKFSETGNINQKSFAQEVLNQHLQIPQSHHCHDHLQILTQGACGQQTGEDTVQHNQQVFLRDQCQDKVQPKDVVSFDSTYTDIYKHYSSNNGSHQHDEHVDLRNSRENKEETQQCVPSQNPETNACAN